jgi:glycosyltransferase involved in cell wall biosynthesis
LTKPKVLMIGPGRGKPGGILALTEALAPVLAQQVELCYFATVQRFAFQEMGAASWRNARLAVGQYGRFLHTLTHFQPDLIHLHTSQGLGWFKDTFYIHAARRYGCPLVLHIHAAEYDALYGGQKRPLQAYTRHMMQQADAVIAVSAGWSEALANIVPAQRIHTFRPCLPVNEFTPTAVTGDGPVNALFLGTVGPRKGVFDLIAAMGQLREMGNGEPLPLHLTIAGGEERYGDLAHAQMQIEALGISAHCQLVGPVQGEAKARLLHTADLFTLPSYNEGLPFAIVEAMAAGLPIVATPVGGIPEVVGDGQNGLLVQPGDIPRLAEALAHLAAHPDLRQRLGQHSRHRAEQELNVVPYTARLVTLYEALLEN